MSGDTNVHRVVGNLLVGTSHFFVDTTTNQVGVNTSTPSAALDVASGDLKVGSDITLASGGTITAANFSGNGSGLSGINSDSGSWVNGTNSNVHLATSTDKVGIGTVDPATYLHLSANNSDPGVTEGDYVGTHNLTEYLRFTSVGDPGDVNAVSVGFKLGDDGSIGANPMGRLDICANHGSTVANASGTIPDKTIATFLGSGNVGIGTSSPGSDKLRIDVGNITSDTVILNTRAQYASSNFGYLQIKEVNHTPSSTDWNGWSTRIQKVVDATQQGYIEFNPAGDPYGISFGNDGGGVTGEVMRIDGINKRLGIGNNNPDGPLHVTFPGNSNFTGITYQNSDVKTVLGNTANDSTNSSFIQVYASVANSVPNANSSKYNLALQPFGGSVGIGTHSPGHVVDIQGSQAYDGSTTLRVLNPASQYGRTQLHLVGRYEAFNDGWSAGGARNAIMFKSQTTQNSGITNQWTIQSFPNGTNNELGFLAGSDNTPKVVFRGDGLVTVDGIIKQTGASWALTNGGVSEAYQYRGTWPGDWAYLNRTLSTPTNVTLTHEFQGNQYTRSRITIGTTGKYAMYINGFRQTGTSGTKELFLHKNGAYVNVRAYSGPESGNTGYSTVGSGYTIMDLNANDYVEVKIQQGTFHGNDSIYFAGHLIA